MGTGQELYDLGTKHVGEKYNFGALVPKNYPDYKGPWDCAEFASWLVFQVSGRLYGCANNFGQPASADAYSGFWARDAVKIGKKISVAEAATIPGAALLRVATGNIIGHVAISNGHGGTVEAHSTKYGVILNKISGRRWDFAVLVPWITYEANDVAPKLTKPPVIYRLTKPMMEGAKVKEIQKALGVTPDGFYGFKTFNAVQMFQRNANLVADGEVGPSTAAKLGVTL